MQNIKLPKIDLNKVRKEYLTLGSILLIILIAFFAYKNVLSPLLGRIKEASAQMERKKADIQKARISPQALSELEKEIEGLKSQIASYRRRLKARAEVPQILKELNQIAEHLKIKFVSVNPLERVKTPLPEGEELLIQLPIKVKLQCGYHELSIFINQIENLPRFTKITDLKLKSDSRNIWTHQAELVVTTYSLVSSNTN